MKIIKSIQSRIYELRGERVMLDFDLAALYEVETRILNQAVKRNIKRFPADFMFQLKPFEYELIRSQIDAFTKKHLITNCDDIPGKTTCYCFALCFYRARRSYVKWGITFR